MQTPTESRSLPVTALENLVAAGAEERAAGAAHPWILAFSGGPDSAALAVVLATVSHRLGVEVHLVHIDHALDSGSAGRAAVAVGLARRLRLPIQVLRRPVLDHRRPGENLEAAARRVRYAALEEARQELEADRILTAHHRDDQVETVLLRIRSGSGIFGLAGIRPRAGALWRPALGLRREELAGIVAGSGLAPNLDPSNSDVARDRNRIRHQILPRLRASNPGIDEALAALALRASGARNALARRLEQRYEMRSERGRWSLTLSALDLHPPSLNLFALQVLEHLAGYDKASSTRARTELLRQIGFLPTGRILGMSGRRWSVDPGGRLEHAPPGASEGKQAPFSYTLSVPGEVAVPELGGRLRLTPSAVESWMLRGESNRAALRFDGPVPTRCEVRNRRPGDRLRPFGAPGIRSLKELLIDRKVPRAERDRVPLLVVGGRIAWVRGITIENDLRLRGESDCWLAEWLPDANQGAGDPRSTFTRDPGTAAMPPEEGKR